MEEPIQAVKAMQKFFANGNTQSFSFRRQQLEKLKKVLVENEEAIYQALFDDLKKNKEEAWITELGFVLAEIRHTIKNLRKWMRPVRVRTNLVNLPSTSRIYKEPLGTVLIVAPWNYPLQLLLAPLVGAIAAGNCVVLKPSEYAVATSALLKKMIDETFDRQYIMLLEGEGAALLPPLLEGVRFDHIFYTGSTATGQKIYAMAAKQLTPVTLELGGKSPCIIESDADLKIAARRIAVTKFSNAGQMCVAPDYILIHESLKETFLNHFKTTLKEFYKDGAAQAAGYGKIINRQQLDRLCTYLEDGKILVGGHYNKELLFMEPTLMEPNDLHGAIMKEELFGPLLPVLTFSSFEEALATIQMNPNPLAFYLFTKSKAKEKQWLAAVAFGGGCINNAAWHLTNYNLPFGGRGNSGIGAYHGKYSFDVFSHSKGVMKTPLWFEPKFKYPPFEGKLKWFKKLVR